MDSLTDQQRQILDLERQFWRTAGAKEDAIRDLGLTPTRYYQLLWELLHDEAALAADPMTVIRLRRIATQRTLDSYHRADEHTATAGRLVPRSRTAR